MLTHSESETIQLGHEIASELVSGDVVAFHGDLGAGKTTLVKGVIHALSGIDAKKVQSPTFTYMNLYEGATPIFHFDLYRLNSEATFLEMGFLDFFESSGICLIEWPSRIMSLLPKKALHVTLQIEGTSTRRIDVQKN